MHVGQIRGGLRQSAKRIAQGSHITVLALFACACVCVSVRVRVQAAALAGVELVVVV